MPDDELIKKTMNFYQLRANPSLDDVDSNDVIRYTPDLSYVKYVDPQIEQQTNIFFMKNEISLNDNILDIFEMDERTEELFEISRMVDYDQRQIDAVADRTYLSLFFRAENQSRQYKRVGYDVLTYLGDLGGLLDFVLMFGFLFTSCFATKLFSAALIGQVYRIQRYAKDFTQFYQTKEVA